MKKICNNFLIASFIVFGHSSTSCNDVAIEQNKQDLLLKEKIAPELNEFVGKAYEEIALQWIKTQKQFRQ
jgi:hypothetical protein